MCVHSLFGFVVELELIETVQPQGERMHSSVDELLIGVSVGVLAEVLSKGSAVVHRRVLAEFVVVFQFFLSSHCAVPWRPA